MPTLTKDKNKQVYAPNKVDIYSNNKLPSRKGETKRNASDIPPQIRTNIVGMGGTTGKTFFKGSSPD